MSLVIDASVFVDYFVRVKGREDRHRKARAFIAKASSLGLIVYEPFLFEVELRGVLVRRMRPSEVERLVGKVLHFINLVGEDELHDTASQVALNTGCRAIDAYYIAAASTTSSILVTNDKTMYVNAKKARVEAYYLLDDYQKLAAKLAEL